MIEVPRGVARSFRAVLKKCVPRSMAKGPPPPVLCVSGKEGLTLMCWQGGVLLRLTSEGNRPEGELTFPATLLADFEAAGEPVRLERPAPMKGRATWSDRGGTRVADFDAPKIDPPFIPEAAMAEPGEGLLAALAEAVQTAGRDGVRHALQYVLLRGSGGSVVANDGRQLLIQGGFKLPWDGDALVPALQAFGCRELSGWKLLLGRAGGHVMLQAGPWLLCLKEEDAKRYPDVNAVIPREDDAANLTIDPRDAAELVRALPSLPGGEEEGAPVTLVLSRRPCVRAGNERLPLARSKCEGPAVSVLSDRRYLLRALKLGLRELSAAQGRPVLCRGEKRTFVWMPLDGPSGPTPPPTPERRERPMPERDGGHDAHTPNGTHAQQPDPLDEAEALRAQLQEALARTSRLIAALRQQKRQDRAVKSAVASLRKLRDLGG